LLGSTMMVGTSVAMPLNALSQASNEAAANVQDVRLVCGPRGCWNRPGRLVRRGPGWQRFGWRGPGWGPGWSPGWGPGFGVGFGPGWGPGFGVGWGPGWRGGWWG
jgi:hypothetical protein